MHPLLTPVSPLPRSSALAPRFALSSSPLARARLLLSSPVFWRRFCVTLACLFLLRAGLREPLSLPAAPGAAGPGGGAATAGSAALGPRALARALGGALAGAGGVRLRRSSRLVVADDVVSRLHLGIGSLMTASLVLRVAMLFPGVRSAVLRAREERGKAAIESILDGLFWTAAALEGAIVLYGLASGSTHAKAAAIWNDLHEASARAMAAGAAAGGAAGGAAGASAGAAAGAVVAAASGAAAEASQAASVASATSLSAAAAASAAAVLSGATPAALPPSSLSSSASGVLPLASSLGSSFVSTLSDPAGAAASGAAVVLAWLRPRFAQTWSLAVAPFASLWARVSASLASICSASFLPSSPALRSFVRGFSAPFGALLGRIALPLARGARWLAVDVVVRGVLLRGALGALGAVWKVVALAARVPGALLLGLTRALGALARLPASALSGRAAWSRWVRWAPFAPAYAQLLLGAHLSRRLAWSIDERGVGDGVGLAVVLPTAVAWARWIDLGHVAVCSFALARWAARNALRAVQDACARGLVLGKATHPWTASVAVVAPLVLPPARRGTLWAKAAKRAAKLAARQAAQQASTNSLLKASDAAAAAAALPSSPASSSSSFFSFSAFSSSSPPFALRVLVALSMNAALLAAAMWLQAAELRVPVVYARGAGRGADDAAARTAEGDASPNDSPTARRRDFPAQSSSRSYLPLRLSPQGTRSLLYVSFWASLASIPFAYLGLGWVPASPLFVPVALLVSEGIAVPDGAERQLASHLAAAEAGLPGVSPGRPTERAVQRRRRALRVLNAIFLALAWLAAQGVDELTTRLIGAPLRAREMLLLASAVAASGRQAAALAARTRADAMAGGAAGSRRPERWDLFRTDRRNKILSALAFVAIFVA